MANRMTTPISQLSLEKRTAQIFLKIAFGASGAPTMDTVTRKGVVSVTRSSAGKYVVVFGSLSNGAIKYDTYNRLVGVDLVLNTVGSAAAPAAPGMYVAGDSVNTPNVASVTLQFTNSTGTATDPASGEIALLAFNFVDSTAP